MKYTVLVNFDKPWLVRCRSDLHKKKFDQISNCYNIRGIWYLPIYTGSKSNATRIASTLKTISASM
jgi:hypothetical protein